MTTLKSLMMVSALLVGGVHWQWHKTAPRLAASRPQPAIPRRRAPEHLQLAVITEHDTTECT